ncbi:MAG: hypothetical protein H0W72_02030 [Planctomycetes bacterium]|nr:hypothetical protein [Planctomycetota bacterium]
MRLRTPSACLAAIIAVGSQLCAAEIAWTGASGRWADAARWNGGRVPVAADSAVLGDVATGTRTVTVATPTTIARLAIDQAGAGTNALLFEHDLTISGGAAPALALTRKGGALTTDMAGRRLTIIGDSLGTLSLPGSWTMGPGSVFELGFANPQGGAELINEGTFSQSGGKLLFHWTSATFNNAVRRFVNRPGATWTMTAGARIDWLADNGIKGGFGAMHDCRNEGSMRIAGDSTISVGLFDNSGALVLDGAVLGGSFDNTVLCNSGTGTVDVVGDAWVGRGDDAPSNQPARIENGGADKAGAQLRVGDGKQPAVLTVKNGESTVKNHKGSTVVIAPQGTLKLAVHASLDPHAYQGRATTIINHGMWTQHGCIQLAPNHVPNATIGVLNKGSFEIVGALAVIERLPSPRSEAYSDANLTSIGNHTGGLLTGSGTLRYRNSTGNVAVGALNVSNSGTIAPGSPANVGILTLVDADVRFADTGSGTLAIRVVGAKPEACDQLVLAGDHGGTFALNAEGSALSVKLDKGFVPKAAAAWRIVTAKQVTGTFSALDLPKGFSVATDATGLTISFKP